MTNQIALRDRCSSRSGLRIASASPATAEMTQEQIGEWRVILEALADAIAPLPRRIDGLGLQIREEMASDTPDRQLIGDLMIQIRGLEERVRIRRSEAIEGMIAALNPEQVEKLASRALAGGLFGGARGGDRPGPRRPGRRVDRPEVSVPVMMGRHGVRYRRLLGRDVSAAAELAARARSSPGWVRR